MGRRLTESTLRYTSHNEDETINVNIQVQSGFLKPLCYNRRYCFRSSGPTEITATLDVCVRNSCPDFTGYKVTHPGDDLSKKVEVRGKEAEPLEQEGPTLPVPELS